MTPRIRVVILDDHQMFRQCLCHMLHCDTGIEVVGEMSRGEDLLQFLNQRAADVLLLDLALPGIGGLEVLERIGGTAIRTILLTAHADGDDLVTAMRLGARGIVLKDSSFDVLVKGIYRVAAGEYWIGHGRIAELIASVKAATAKPCPAQTVTEREREIMAAVVQGATNKQIAQQFRLSEQTVKNHLSNIFDKLGVSNRLELVLFAINRKQTSRT